MQKEEIQPETDDPELQLYIGKSFIEGIDNFPVNISKGVHYLELSIQKKNIDAGIYYCSLLINGIHVPKNLENAEIILNIFIDFNNSDIFYLYGELKKQQQKYNESIEYFKKSSEMGNIKSMANLGIMFRNCEEIGVNKEEAFHYFKISADHNDVISINQIVEMYENREYIPSNDNELAHYFKLAVDNNNIYALFYYALF